MREPVPPDRMPTTPKPRNWMLDCLRLVAVVVVIWHHQLGSEAVQVLPGLWRVSVQGGWVGVDLFFVLSGYLVGGLLFEEQVRCGSIDWKRFLIRRGLKIYPAFYVLLAVILLPLVLHHELPERRRIIGEVFFLQNYLGGLRDHTWSLAVEEHFYLLLTALVVWLSRRKPTQPDPFTAIPLVFVGVAVVCLGLRIATSLLVPQSINGPYVGTHLRLDALGFGVLLAYAAQFHGPVLRHWLEPRRPWLVLAGVLLLLPAYVLPAGTGLGLLRTLGYTTNYLGAGLLVAVAAIRAPEIPPRWLGWLAAIGAYSYSIYLWHLEVIRRLYGKLHLEWGWSPWTTAGCCLLGSLVIGVVLGRCVEWPVLWWRNRVFPSRSGVGNSDPKVVEAQTPTATIPR